MAEGLPDMAFALLNSSCTELQQSLPSLQLDRLLDTDRHLIPRSLLDTSGALLPQFRCAARLPPSSDDAAPPSPPLTRRPLTRRPRLDCLACSGRTLEQMHQDVISKASPLEREAKGGLSGHQVRSRPGNLPPRRLPPPAATRLTHRRPARRAGDPGVRYHPELPWRRAGAAAAGWRALGPGRAPGAAAARPRLCGGRGAPWRLHPPLSRHQPASQRLESSGCAVWGAAGASRAAADGRGRPGGGAAGGTAVWNAQRPCGARRRPCGRAPGGAAASGGRGPRRAHAQAARGGAAAAAAAARRDRAPALGGGGGPRGAAAAHRGRRGGVRAGGKAADIPEAGGALYVSLPARAHVSTAPPTDAHVARIPPPARRSRTARAPPAPATSGWSTPRPWRRRWTS
jgi:hypothetical protein